MTRDSRDNWMNNGGRLGHWIPNYKLKIYLNEWVRDNDIKGEDDANCIMRNAMSDTDHLQSEGLIPDNEHHSIVYYDEDYGLSILRQHLQKLKPVASGLKTTGTNTPAHKGTSMKTKQFPGMNKLMDRMFRKAEGVVWDLMSGRIGVQTDEGIATLNGTGDDAEVSLNLMDDFGMALPAYAQSTPKNGVMVGDIIYRGAKNNIAWVIEKKEVEKDGVITYKFKLMKPNGETTSWNPPKISLMGFESGVMVLRSLISMLPGGQGDLANMQGMMMPMMLLLGDDDEDEGGNEMMDKMMPFILMQMVNGQGAAGGMGGMGGMMQMMFMQKLMGGKNDLFGGGSKNRTPAAFNSAPFNRN